MGDVRSQAGAASNIKVVKKAEKPEKDSRVKEEYIKPNTATMVPKARWYASSELGITRASMCAPSGKIYVPTQREQ